MERIKVWFWGLLDVFIVAAVVGMVFFVMPLLYSLRSSIVPTHVITVSAEGKTTATPDLAELSFSVVSQGSDPKALSEDNNRKMDAITKFVSSEGIADKDMKTTSYDLQPNYRYDNPTGKNTIFGYTLTQTLSIKVRDLTKVAEVLGGVAPLGVNQIGGVNFTFDDPEKFLAVARADAFTKIKQKAQAMADAAGVSLGVVVTVSENGNTPYPIYYNRASAMTVGAAMAPTAPPIQPGSQDVTDNVTITYALQ